MLSFLARRKKVLALVNRLDLALTGHTGPNKIELLASYHDVITLAAKEGKTIRDYGGKAKTIHHWVMTNTVSFTDNTTVPFHRFSVKKS